MEVGERLNEIINHFDQNINSFSKSIGLKNNVTLMRIVKGNTTPSFTTLQKIKNTYPELNVEWILTGEGEMIKGSTKDNDWFQHALDKAQKEIEWHKDIINTLQKALENQTKLIEDNIKIKKVK